MKESGFSRRFSSTGFRLWRNQPSTRKPFLKVYSHKDCPTFAYIGVGPIAIYRDGQRIGIGRR